MNASNVFFIDLQEKSEKNGLKTTQNIAVGPASVPKKIHKRNISAELCMEDEQIGINTIELLTKKREDLFFDFDVFGKTELKEEIAKLDAMIKNYSVPIPELPEIVKTYYTKFGEVIWYPNEKLIECQGAKFTELEILKLAGSGLAVSEFELELKKVFPFSFLL